MERYVLPELRYLAELSIKHNATFNSPLEVFTVGDAKIIGTQQDIVVFEHMKTNSVEKRGDDPREVLPEMVAALEELYGERASRERFWGHATADALAASNPEFAAYERDVLKLRRLDADTFEAVTGRKMPAAWTLPEGSKITDIMSEVEYAKAKPFMTVPGLPGGKPLAN